MAKLSWRSGRHAARHRVAEALIGQAVVPPAHRRRRARNLHLFLARQGEERAAFAVDRSDVLLVHPVADNAEEPDLLACAGNGRDDWTLVPARRGERRDVDDGNLRVGCGGALAIGNESIARHGCLFIRTAA
jgi:hypothetical protein